MTTSQVSQTSSGGYRHRHWTVADGFPLVCKHPSRWTDMDVHPALVEMLASVLPMKAELRIAAPVGSGRRSAEHASKVSPWTFSSRDFGMGAAIIILNDKGGIELRDSAYEPIRKIARSFGIGWLPSVPYSFEVPGWETQVFNKLKIDRRLK